jgi:hypothetical protein
MPDQPTAVDNIHATLTALDILVHLGVAAFLGIVVAGSYLVSARHREGAAGLTTTLILLAMLISMVTLAIGSNLAVAFTLVGTLAIVRFRTPVRDVRDTAFVIFAVAAGISASALSWDLAMTGTCAIAGVGALLSLRPLPTSEDSWVDAARINVTLEGPDPDVHVLVPVLERYAYAHRVLSARTAKEADAMRIVFEAHLHDRDAAPQLVTSLQALATVRRATLTYVYVPAED